MTEEIIKDETIVQDYTILERRADGSFVVERFGMPYHVPRGWPEWAEAAAKAAVEETL